MASPVVGTPGRKPSPAYGKKAAAGTETFPRSVPGLDDTFPPLVRPCFPPPYRPRFPPEGRVRTRRPALQPIRATARHAGPASHVGHADIVREPLEGATVFEPVAKERGSSWK